MKKTIILHLGVLLLCALALSACAGGASVATHNSRNSLDWTGTYTGLIPSASGMGIEVRLTLNGNGTYALNYHYVGRADPDFSSTGNFTWNNAGSVITLDSITGPLNYQVGENMLRQLDMDGKVITGNLADMYILRKG
jgi:uncharacterized lipoprotein NlpE involved in copper resistance